MKDWFKENEIKNGNEIVIQVINKENFIYRLIPEQKFIKETRELQLRFDRSESEQEASEKLATIAQWTSLDKKQVVYNEYNRLVNTITTQDREYVEKRLNRARETTPANLRTLLGTLYQGHCQMCDFWFLKRDNSPYFEIHHLNPLQGHHPKNLVVVCGNCHNQFEHANIHSEYNKDAWLIRVSFNERIYQVNQIALNMKWEDSVKALFI
jgi:predicted HNH restriction endonuclease